MKLKPIAMIHSPFRQATGTPIQPRAAQGAEGTVEVFSEYLPGLKDLEGFERSFRSLTASRLQDQVGSKRQPSGEQKLIFASKNAQFLRG
jgi:tRNA (Thr-GGU) A37 N-methylase